MRKQIRSLRVDPELRNLSLPMDPDEYRRLEDSLRLMGCVEPLTIWNKTIVDGHKRYAICQRYGIPFAVQNRDFADKADAARWLLEQRLPCAASRYECAEYALRYAPYLHKAEKQEKGHCIRTRDRLAGMAGVSHGTLDKVKYICIYGDEAIKARARRGELSIHRAYRIVWNRKNAWRLGG